MLKKNERKGDAEKLYFPPKMAFNIFLRVPVKTWYANFSLFL